MAKLWITFKRSEQFQSKQRTNEMCTHFTDVLQGLLNYSMGLKLIY
jgi:hypothetical protein